MNLRFVSALLVLLAQVLETTAADVQLLAGPMIGHMTSRDVRIWIRASGPAKWSVKVGKTADLRGSKEFRGPLLKNEDGDTGHVVINGLEAETKYFYSISLNGKTVLVPPYPSF